MLKFKISNLEKKYAAIKNAFRIIRTKTPIDDPKRIFSGFQ
jgi:hypothetical protein